MELSAAYEITESLDGDSAFSIRRARRCSDGLPVFVKLAAEDGGPERAARLRHEFSVLRSLELPGVVRAVSLEKREHGVWLVLEDLGGQSLHHRIQLGPPELPEFLRIAIEIAAIVESIHAAGVIHKDIKPQHLFFTERGLKLVDFGHATRLSSEAQPASNLRRVEGSLAYMSPEQTGRMNRVLDRRTDLYSLGVTLYELLTGRLPFEAEDPLELVHCHIARVPPSAHELRPEVPRALSAVLAKLLSKTAESRYQSAAGLRVDLEACVHALEFTGEIAPFPLGRYDVSDELRIPQKLYGREHEYRTLLAKFEQARDGTVELLLISGPSGVGKSALVNEIQKQVVRGGACVSGKFDQVGRAIPYAPIAVAFRQLVRLVLAAPPDKLAQWAAKLKAALGRNGKLVVELCPELELVIGPQPDLPPLPAVESQHRFELALEQFLQVFSGPAHPLVLFLDDVQWIDSASLRLLQRILSNRSSSHLCVVGAYRDNEVDALHPLALALAELGNAGVAISELSLAPLALPHLTELLRDTLQADEADVRPLAEATLGKTHGNPFFVSQFLTSLRDQQIIAFDSNKRRWTWDMEKARGAIATDNVVDFLIQRLRGMSPAAQHVLTLAACIGHEFDRRTLGLVAQRPAEETARGLWEALREGLVLPLDAGYRYLDTEGEAGATGALINTSYRFLHDRVEQAARGLLAPSDSPAVHLRIGRLLLEACHGAPKDNALFEVVAHLNLGASVIESSGEGLALARLDTEAGCKAKDAGAHATALSLLGTALALLGEDPWQRDYATALRAHLARAECEFLSGGGEAAHRWLDAVEQHARTTLDRAAGRSVRIAILTGSNQLTKAAAFGVETARLLGAAIPDVAEGIGPAIGGEIGALTAVLEERSIESLLDLPAMTEPEKLALADVLFKTNPAAFQTNPALSALIGLKAVHLAIEHGNAPNSAYFYANYGIIHAVATGDRDTAYRFGRLGIDLCTRAGESRAGGATHFLYAAFNAHWRRPIAESITHFRLGLKTSLEEGDYLHACWCATLSVYARFHSGEALDEIEADMQDTLELLRRSEDLVTQDTLHVVWRGVRALSGRTTSAGTLDGDGFDSADFLCRSQGSQVHNCYYHVIQALVLYYAEDYAASLTAADRAEPLLPGLYFTCDHALYRALARLELARKLPESERGALLEGVQRDFATLESAAGFVAENHAQRKALVEAELAALSGDPDRALSCYESALEAARQNAHVQHEALAHELAARFHAERGRARMAQRSLGDAIAAYRRWGAKAKLAMLAERHPALFHEPALERATRPNAVRGLRSASLKTSLSLSAEDFDLASAIRATQALSGELEIGRLLERLMRALIENAGAQKGVLVLERGGRLEVEAAITLAPAEMRLNLAEALHESRELAPSVVEYVARSREICVVADAGEDPRFLRDPYVERAEPRSLLCMPMLHQGRLSGILYLENNLTPNAFGAARVELLQFLAAQAAIALENAKLYGEVYAAGEKLRRANETLELEVAERTQELSRTVAELWSEMDLARKIQTVLLPSENRLRDYEIAASMVPAEIVGGDYYDIIQKETGDWVLIGDVSGHGVTAGLTMMMVQTAIRTVVLGAECLSPAQVLARVNTSVRGNLLKMSRDHYMTIAGFYLDGPRVRYSGLHQDILVYRARQGRVERAQTQGMWIGPLEDISELLVDDTLELEPGDVLLLYTDGATEIKVGQQMLGTDGLSRIFCELAATTRDPRALLDAIMRRLPTPANDDVTVMALRYAPREAAE